jgi:hypothetical protein
MLLRLSLKVVEFFFRLMKNADHDIAEKSELEISAAFEGSGVAAETDASDQGSIQ